MSIEQALGIAKNAQSTSKDAYILANKAHEVANISLVRHEVHEKVCADRYTQIISVHNDTQKEIKMAKNWLISFLIVSVIGLIGILYTGLING